MKSGSGHHIVKINTGLTYLNLVIVVISGILIQSACSKDDNSGPVNPPDDTIPDVQAVDTAYIRYLSDTYYDIYSFSKVYQWGPYNVHDPSVLYDGDYFYCYSTDVFYGLPIERAGIQVRKSGNLVKWHFMGWAYDGIPSQAIDYFTANGSVPVDNVWAPYILKVNGQYRLYYSQASNKAKLSVIGLTTSEDPGGPWTQKGLVVTSDDYITMPNAIDPSVIVVNDGKHWMFYGSSWDGIYVLEINPETGLAMTPGSKGKRIAHRGFTNGTMNGNIEAPEIIYNQELDKYFLFISYDWLETKYNVRVGRADRVDGPYYDYQGADLNMNSDNIPMILAPYAFTGHSGWQGTGHCSVFEKDGQYFMAHQGRPAVDKYFMDLHIRRILWTVDGWPVVSPERYAGISTSKIDSVEITGHWERIEFEYNVVPGFGEEQTDPDIQQAVAIILGPDGTINGNSSYIWVIEGQRLRLNWNNITIDDVYIERGWDWENKRETLLFSGLNNLGTAIWGKKVQ